MVESHSNLLNSTEHCIQTLRKREDRFRNIVEKSIDGVVILDINGIVHFVNPAAEILLERKAEEMIQKEFDFPAVSGKTSEIEIMTNSKEMRFAEMRVVETDWEGKSAYLALIRDITDRKLVEEKIKRSYHIQSVISAVLQISLEPISLNKQLERILDLILTIPWISLQSKGCIYLVEDNPEMLVMKVQRHLSESLLTGCIQIPFDKCLCGLAASTRKIIFSHCIDKRHEIHYQGMLPHGHYCIPILFSNEVLGVINLYVRQGHHREQKEIEFLTAIASTLAGVIQRQRTQQDKKRLQEKLIHYEKLTALGRLTANVAHEIRNPLTVLGGFARRLYRTISDDTKEKEYTKVIVSETSRLEKILNSVLAFSKDVSLFIEELNINKVVDESLESFETLCREQAIDIQKSLSTLPKILIDKEQISQTINHLLSNAIDAMPNGGSLTITSGKEFLNGIVYVVVRIADEGEGISSDKLNMIFEPFFTTKAVRQFYGTGLGLSVSRKIMEKHCGFVRAESRVGKGSTFSLYFPYQREEEASKLQCWQFLKCGRDCNLESKCPAYPHYGRSCWAVAGTYCEGKLQGNFAEKIETCSKCPFYQKIMKSNSEK